LSCLFVEDGFELLVFPRAVVVIGLLILNLVEGFRECAAVTPSICTSGFRMEEFFLLVIGQTSYRARGSSVAARLAVYLSNGIVAQCVGYESAARTTEIRMLIEAGIIDRDSWKWELVLRANMARGCSGDSAKEMGM